MHSELPKLLEIDERPSRNVMRFTPTIDRLFRPEEKHGRSRVNDIVPPARCGDREVSNVRLWNRAFAFDFKCQSLA